MSGYNAKLNSLFIHVPKTGGCSIANFPWNPGNGHDTFGDFESKLGDKIKTAFAWAFVRNPWARIASAYEDCPEVWAAAPTFRIFLETLAANWSDLDGVKQARFSSTYKFGLPVGRIHFLPQSLLLNDANGNLGVDFVGRFENMAEDLAKVQKRLGVPVKAPPHHNARKNKRGRRNTPLAELFEPDLVDLVGDLFEKDWRAFGYSPPF